MKNRLEMLEKTKKKFENEMEKEIQSLMKATGLTRAQIMEMVESHEDKKVTVH